MNVNKAREYFSAYHEGSLDKGLRQSFERALKTDAQLQAEYRAFESTMQELSGLGARAVEIPEDLHEKISAHLDKHVWEAKQVQKAGVAGWWRILAIGAAATAVLAIALVRSNQSQGDPNVTPAGIVGLPEPIKPPQSKLEIKATATGVSLSYTASGVKRIVETDADGKELEAPITLNNESIANKPLSNSGEQAQLIGIRVGEDPTVWVALPGSAKKEMTVATGTLKQFILAIADHYRMPVVLSTDDVDAEVTWEPQDNALTTVTKLGETHKLRAELRGDSLLWIQKH